MKSNIALLTAALLGGTIVLTGDYLLGKIEKKNVHPAHYRVHPIGYSTTAAPLDFTKAAEVAMPTVVHIKASESVQSANERLYSQRSLFDPFDFFFGPDRLRNYHHKQVGYGSGVIINKKGLIVTNNHVVDFADELEVTLHDNRKYSAKIVGRDPQSDLALIQMDGKDFDYIDFGNSDEVKVGQWVVAVGNPFDLTSTVTAGIISAKGRNNILNRKDAIEDFIQTDAVVNPGNSGGALVDIDGRLIGINTAIASPDGVYAGYAFAIPSNLVANIINDIQKQSSQQKDKAGYLGAELEEVDQYAKETYGILAESGALIVAIQRESPAYFAEMKPGDVIIEINDKSVKDLDDAAKIMEGKKVDERVVFTILRGRQLKEITVILRAKK